MPEAPLADPPEGAPVWEAPMVEPEGPIRPVVVGGEEP